MHLSICIILNCLQLGKQLSILNYMSLCAAIKSCEYCSCVGMYIPSPLAWTSFTWKGVFNALFP